MKSQNSRTVIERELQRKGWRENWYSSSRQKFGFVDSKTTEIGPDRHFERLRFAITS
jgi:hypothetical protein